MLTKDNDGVGVVAAAAGNVAVAVGLLVRVGASGDLLEQIDDLVGLFGALGLDAERAKASILHKTKDKHSRQCESRAIVSLKATHVLQA